MRYGPVSYSSAVYGEKETHIWISAVNAVEELLRTGGVNFLPILPTTSTYLVR
jgi:hypothetical protein